MTAPNPVVHLLKKRDQSVLRRHPWIFAGAVQRVEGEPAPGDTVEVKSGDGKWLARGAWSPESQIRVRTWSDDPDETIDASFFRKKLDAALTFRREIGIASTDMFRVVNAEADGLPGVVIDKYGEWCVCQILSAGAEKWRDAIAHELMSLTECRGVFERSEGDARQKEGFSERRGVILGEEPPALIECREGNVRYLVDVRAGHKTGFYLDQRANRASLAAVARDRDVLNCFCYTGGFGLAASTAGARSVLNVDSSAEALDLGRRQAELNCIDAARIDFQQADVFQLLRRMRDSRQEFDIIVLDPPKFAASASQVDKAARGYKDINLLAMKLLRRGGLLFTFSCSGHITPPLFQKIIADAAIDAGRETRVTEWLHQAPDHPVALNFPEGHYLKGLVVRVGG